MTYPILRSDLHELGGIEMEEMKDKKMKIVAVERNRWFSWKPLLPMDAIVEHLYDNQRYQNIVREFAIQPEEEPTFAKSVGEVISLLMDSKKKLSSKEKEDIYKMAYMDGARDGIDYMKHVFVGDDFSKEKLEKLMTFCHDEGIEIAVSPNGGIYICDMWKYPEKFVEWKIVYE